MNYISFKIACILALAVPDLASTQVVRVNPAVLQWKTAGLNVKSKRTLSIENTSDQSIKVQLITEPPFSASLKTLLIPENSNQEIDIFFTSIETGLAKGILDLRVLGFFDKQNTQVELHAQTFIPRLIIEPKDSLDFGKIELGKQFQNRINLFNPGQIPVTITKISWLQYSNQFTISNSEPIVLLPDKRSHIKVNATPRETGTIKAELHILTGYGRQDTLQISAHVSAAKAIISPLSEVGVKFGNVELGQEIERDITIINNGDAELVIDSIRVQGDNFSIKEYNGLPFTVHPNTREVVTVIFAPKTRDIFSSTLFVYTNDPTNKEIRMPVHGQGNISPAKIEILNGDNINFGRVPIGKTTRDHLLLWNRGGSPFAVDIELRDNFGAEFDHGHDGTFSSVIKPGQTDKISLDFSPKEVGERKASLTVTTESRTNHLLLRGIGQFLKLSPSTVDFGRIAVGETSSQVVEIANIGNSDLTINQLRSTSKDFNIYTQIDPNNRLKLPANSLRTIPVHISFTPSSRGTISSSLRIDGYWSEGTETLDILLNGTGVAAEIELNPTGTIDFGYVILGKKEERNIVATNSGDTILQVQAHPETPEVHVQPSHFSLGPGESTRLKVRFTPASLGERFGRILLISNDVQDKARPIQLKANGALENIDLASIVRLNSSRKDKDKEIFPKWNNTPIIEKDQTKIDVIFGIPDSLRQALIGRNFLIEWTKLDENYDPQGGSQTTTVKIYESSEIQVVAEDLNLRLTEDENRRIRLKITTSSYPGAPPQSISQILEAGGWKWEFEAKPLVSFLTIRPGRNYQLSEGDSIRTVRGKTERLIGLPGIAFAGWHNVDNPSISGIHFTAIGNVLEAISTGNRLAVSLGLAVSFYKDQFLFGFGWDIYDSREKSKRKGSQDYIMTFKYSGLFR
jgi:hypothetical protein